MIWDSLSSAMTTRTERLLVRSPAAMYSRFLLLFTDYFSLIFFFCAQKFPGNICLWFSDGFIWACSSLFSFWKQITQCSTHIRCHTDKTKGSKTEHFQLYFCSKLLQHICTLHTWEANTETIQTTKQNQVIASLHNYCFTHMLTGNGLTEADGGRWTWGKSQTQTYGKNFQICMHNTSQSTNSTSKNSSINNTTKLKKNVKFPHHLAFSLN